MVQEGLVESPGFTTEDATGNRVDSTSFRGKVVVLNFWATWCPPCRLEMPAMERLYQEFRGRGLEIVAVNFMESRELVQAFAEEQKLTYPMLLDSRAEIAEQYGVMRLPETVLIGREGELIAKTIGYKEWYKEDVRELVADLLDNGKAGRGATGAGTPWKWWKCRRRVTTVPRLRWLPPCWSWPGWWRSGSDAAAAPVGRWAEPPRGRYGDRKCGLFLTSIPSRSRWGLWRCDGTA